MRLKDRILKFEAPSAATKNEQTSTRKPQHGKVNTEQLFSHHMQMSNYSLLNLL